MRVDIVRDPVVVRVVLYGVILNGDGYYHIKKGLSSLYYKHVIGRLLFRPSGLFTLVIC